SAFPDGRHDPVHDVAREMLEIDAHRPEPDVLNRGGDAALVRGFQSRVERHGDEYLQGFKIPRPFRLQFGPAFWRYAALDLYIKIIGCVGAGELVDADPFQVSEEVAKKSELSDIASIRVATTRAFRIRKGEIIFP